MCTGAEFDTIFKTLVKKKKIEISEVNTVFKNFNQKDSFEAIDRLVVLGFASKTRYFNGDELATITEKGKQMYKATH